MIRKQSINRIILVIFHLALFAWPLVNKGLHTHKKQAIACTCACAKADGPAFGQQADNCPICEYEFYKYFHQPEFRLKSFSYCYPIFEAPHCRAIPIETIRHYSLRGPPAA